MACQGPDVDKARKFGKQVGEFLFEELVKEYNMNPPFVLPNAEKRWKKAKAAFVKSVVDLFVEDACNSF